MHKSAAEWIHYTQDNVEALARHWHAIPDKQAAISAWLNWSESGLSKALKAIRENPAHWQLLSEPRYRSIIERYIRFLPGGRDFFSNDIAFLGLGQFHKLTASDLLLGIAAFAGTFVSYRFSHLLRDRKMVLRGLTEISTPEEKDAINIRSFYRVQAGVVGTNEVTFERRGYLIPRSANRAILTSFKLDPIRDEERIFIHKSVPYGSGPKAGQILHMHGHIVDWEDSDFYLANFYGEREDLRSIDKDASEVCRAFEHTAPEVAGPVKELRSWSIVSTPEMMTITDGKPLV